ncbi:Mss4-like protein [Mucor lusitanicus]|uniref:CENP-V/GFA domain-containing protein n=2 Tax=Mucor circinelloides f. lusitanicus TaxID=29924 RepID=A0A168GJD8_MUCCL|nr:Mss4-like protein [Mucor lusitanicus]OAC97747.1 hypothetical protein MUCCIDRAFT_157586 [Mucor lusitanicus CBS 277.49]
MELKGSCHCEKVSFTVLSHTPAPFMRCYCSICRKCQGGGGYAINIMGQYDTLKVTGKEYLREYQALRDKETKELCGNIRYFCGECGCHLYAYDKKWSEFVYPYACAIDTPLPELDSKDVYHIMLDSKANWVQAPKADEKQHAFKEYPDCSLEDWHKNNKQYI